MKIKGGHIIRDEPKENYEFHNPSDTLEVLFGQILKRGIFVYNQKTRKEEKQDWEYICKENYPKNINLLFSKIIPQTQVPNEKGENKEKHLQLIIREFGELIKGTMILPSLKQRNDKLIEDLENIGFICGRICAECSWRLIVGLGALHPQETSMTLHHIYGIPYIPGSALKGVTRHWSVRKFAYQKAKCENQRFEQALKDVSKALEDGKYIDLKINGTSEIGEIKFDDLRKIFGTKKEVGKVIFMDAYPVGDIGLKIDIMNVHYPDYYSGNKAPADWQKPVPIKFLTVEKTKFEFVILSRNQDLVRKTEKLLKEALSEHGIGAKTSLGYGLFDV